MRFKAAEASIKYNYENTEVMKNTSIKLAELVHNYPYFEKDQVLTDDHLNTIVTYLDQQHRLTRRNLHGYGTVCGLKLSSSNFSIVLSKGCGLTTDGDLLEVDENQSFAYYRDFKDENAKYPLFKNVDVYELVESGETAPKNAKSLRRFKTNTKNKLTDYTAMLYLESYLLDPDICTGGDCDNKGQVQVNKLRVLLIPKEVIDKRLNLFSPAKQYFKLNHLNLARLKPGAASIDSYAKLASAYLNIIVKANKELGKELPAAFKLLKPLFDEVFNNTDPTGAWVKKLNNIVEKANKSTAGVQYVYDFFKDLIQAYNEFVESVYGWETKCLPDINAAPKHLLLGDAIASIPDKTDRFRQGFVESPMQQYVILPS